MEQEPSTTDDADLNARLRKLPSVDRVLEALSDEASHAAATGAARRAIDHARDTVRLGGKTPAFESVVETARSFLRERDRSLLQPVINATGVLIHTNLGRVPLGEEQLDAIRQTVSAYSNLEYDLATGTRGSRYVHATGLVSELTGAEAALVVNNNAAAVLLALTSLCGGREVIISRGELVEIGGEFRIPDVMASSGARLVEVGTTNRTHLADYERAITPETAAILKVHPSNYRVVGFTAEVAARDIARLARGRGISLIYDVGSGLLSHDGNEWTSNDPSVRAAFEDGADIVTFSGDKLLGGPQAGVIAGRAGLVERIARHPLLRALRPDKMTLAALEATLAAHAEGRAGELPLWEMANADADRLRSRAEVLVDELSSRLGSGFKVEAVALKAVAGGGSLPGADLPSYGIWIEQGERSSAELQRILRHVVPPVVGRIEDDRLLLDLRTVPASQDELLVRLIAEGLRGRV